jgi:hypothetical protein
MRIDRPEVFSGPGVQDARTEQRARRMAARHLSYTRSHLTTQTTASDLLWDAAVMAARQATQALPGNPEEAVMHARAFRLPDESWWRLMRRHERNRPAPLTSRRENGPATPSLGAAESSRPTSRERTHGSDVGVDGP